MSIATADLYEAIAWLWDDNSLDAKFKALWSDPNDADFAVLYDQEAAPYQPYPYCVLDQVSIKTDNRMDGGDGTNQEVRTAQCRFNIHVQEVTGDSRSPKQIAAYLSEELMKVFGGHPTIPAQCPPMSNGAVLNIQYQNDYGVRVDDGIYQWVLAYTIWFAVPVAK